jgi:hypothetical protein
MLMKNTYKNEYTNIRKHLSYIKERFFFEDNKIGILFICYF